MGRTKGVVDPRIVTAGISEVTVFASSPDERHSFPVWLPGVTVTPVPELGIGGT